MWREGGGCWLFGWGLGGGLEGSFGIFLLVGLLTFVRLLSAMAW